MAGNQRPIPPTPCQPQRDEDRGGPDRGSTSLFRSSAASTEQGRVRPRDAADGTIPGSGTGPRRTGAGPIAERATGDRGRGPRSGRRAQAFPVRSKPTGRNRSKWIQARPSRSKPEETTGAEAADAGTATAGDRLRRGNHGQREIEDRRQHELRVRKKNYSSDTMLGIATCIIWGPKATIYSTGTCANMQKTP
jgi:hypothetical protein